MGLFVKKLISLGFTAIEVTALRFMLAAACMLLFTVITDRKSFRIKIRDIWKFAFIGIISTFSTSAFYFLSMSYISIAAADVLMYTSPIWVLIFSFVFLKEKITFKKLLCIMAAFTGTAFVSGMFNSGGSAVSIPGILFGLCSGLAYASYSIMGKYILRDYNETTFMVYGCMFAGITSLFAVNISKTADIVRSNPGSAVYALLLAIVSTALPYYLYTMGLKRTAASKAAVICCIEPVTAAVLSVFVVREPFHPAQLLGIILILSSIIFLTVKTHDRTGAVQTKS